MPRAPIIPDSQIIRPPLEPYLRIVVLRDEIEKIGEYEVGFVFCDAVDALGEAFVHVDRFPARDS
jgi:hypothetical protein